MDEQNPGDSFDPQIWNHHEHPRYNRQTH
jgi:hypothetical protein